MILLAVAALIGLDAVPASAAGTANPWLKRRVLNIAHQGGEDEFPSNTLYAFRKATRAGADMLELDVGVTKDDQVVVMHDTSVDRTTNGTGLISEMTLREIQRLDAGYWFSADSGNHYSHDQDPNAYRFRGLATDERRPPKGFKAADFRVPTLRSVLRAFPDTPINIEIKGRTKEEEASEYVYNAEVLARELARTKRNDLIVVSFQQPAVDRFHELAPRVGVAPGVTGVAGWVLDGTAPASGTVAFQLPVTFQFGQDLLRRHHGGERRARPRRGLRSAHLVLGRRRRRSGDLAHARRRVRRRHHDVAPRRAGTHAQVAPGARGLRREVSR